MNDRKLIGYDENGEAMYTLTRGEAFTFCVVMAFCSAFCIGLAFFVVWEVTK